MGKNYFTLEQVEQLRKNKYVKHVSEKAITYTEEFKEIFILEYKSGKSPSQILTEMGFNCKVLGKTRIDNISRRVRAQSKRPEGFNDTRSTESGRPRTKGLTPEEQMERLKLENEVLKAKVEFLSLLRRAERETAWKESKSKKKESSK